MKNRDRFSCHLLDAIQNSLATSKLMRSIITKFGMSVKLKSRNKCKCIPTRLLEKKTSSTDDGFEVSRIKKVHFDGTEKGTTNISSNSFSNLENDLK